jgi:hypothetical protein
MRKVCYNLHGMEPSQALRMLMMRPIPSLSFEEYDELRQHLRYGDLATLDKLMESVAASPRLSERQREVMLEMLAQASFYVYEDSVMREKTPT